MKFAGTLKTFIQITILLICMLNITIEYAVEFQARGSGIFQYDERFKKRNYEGYKEQAIKQAVQKAWSQYVSSLPQVKRSSYQRIEANFMTNLNRYISSVVVLDESHNKRTKTVEVLIRAAINDDEVNATLNANSAIKQAQASDDASYFSVVFLARKVTKVKQFRELETSIVAKEGVAMASESAVVSGTSISTSQSNESFSKTKTGGNTEIKRDILTYEVTSPASINSSMEEILSPAGYEVVGYGDIVGECGGVEPSQIMQEFMESDDMSRQTRRSAINAARECDVSYFATGTLDIGEPGTDPISGNTMIYVAVRGQVWDITKRLPRGVASVGPVQFAGMGPNATVAENNALILASKGAAQSLVDQMNAKGLR